jgi:hypothetical protein
VADLAGSVGALWRGLGDWAENAGAGCGAEWAGSYVPGLADAAAVDGVLSVERLARAPGCAALPPHGIRVALTTKANLKKFFGSFLQKKNRFLSTPARTHPYI